MVKKYYITKKDRKDERSGMKTYEKNPYKNYRMDMDSGYMGMISEDHSAPSNLPQDVKHKYYPECDYVDKYSLDDTIKGIDDNNRNSVRKVEKFPSKSMY